MRVEKIPWRRAWQPTPVFLPGKFHGQRSLAGYSPWDCKELDVTECTHVYTHTHTSGITLLWFQFCLLNISCYWSWYWSSGLFLTTDGILIARFNDINTPTSGGSLSHDAEQLFQYSATPAWNSNFPLNYQAPLSCFLLYVSVTLSHISLEHLSECFEINNSHPGSLLAHKTPLYELEKGTLSLEKSEKDRIMPTMYFYKVPGTN